MKKIITILSALAVLTIFSCRQKESSGVVPADYAIRESSVTEKKAPEKIDNPVVRKIIKEGEISFETADVNQTKSLIVKTVQELNGYISKDNVSNYSGKPEHRLVIRVPSDKFDLLLNKISESADKLDSKNVDVLDVTAEYIDIDARIKTKKELEDRYKELLKQATKVDEVLSIEKEIGLLRTEIESVEGQMKYLEDRISYSTLIVTYYQKADSAFGFASKLGQALKSGWSDFLWFLIGLTHLWVFILIGLAAVSLIIRQRRKKKGKQ